MNADRPTPVHSAKTRRTLSNLPLLSRWRTQVRCRHTDRRIRDDTAVMSTGSFLRSNPIHGPENNPDQIRHNLQLTVYEWITNSRAGRCFATVTLRLTS